MATEAEVAVPVAVQPRRWTREEYERLGELGVLGPDERVELIEGEIVARPPQGTPHAVGIRLSLRALRQAYDAEFDVSSQLPLALGQYSEPEPDVAVVTGSPREFLKQHPTSALLVVEIADSTLRFDRDVKSSLYAAAGIPHYWLINLIDRQLEMHRDPGPLPDTRYGYGYRTRTIALPGEVVEVPAPAAARLAVDDLLP